MNLRCITISTCLVACCLTMLASAAYWTEKTSSPSRFPYEVGTANNRQMDLPIPVATNRTFVAYQNSAGGQTPGPMFQTNMIVWSTVDPRYGEEGYWPTYHSAAIFGGGKYYVCGGVGPNVNLSGIYGIAGHNGLSIVMGYMWPSNSWNNGEGYSYNRQAGFSVYDPVADTWESASWTNDLNGYCIQSVSDPSYGTYVSRKPLLGQGTWIGANQAFSYDWDGDGVDEIFMHGGYPHWDGYCAVFDPNRGVNGEWTTTAAANNFSSGFKAQMYGGAVRVGSNIYCIGGNYWGPDGATHMQVYDPALNTWQTYQNVYTNQLRYFGCAAVGTKIYMFSGEQSPNITYSPHVYAIDVSSPETISNGVKIVGQVMLPVCWPSMVSWKGMLYIVGGMSSNGTPTNVFQVFNPATEATVLSAETLPVSAYAASCAVSPSGTFYFGGAMRMTDPVSGWLVNSSRLWSGPMPEQDIFVAPNFLDFWQVTNDLVLRIDNATGLPIACTNTPMQGWLSVLPQVVTVPGGGTVYCTVTVNRTMFSGPTNGAVQVTWASGSATIPVAVDTLRPIADLAPPSTITLQPRTKSFMLGNSGAVPMYFTNTSADAFVTAITPDVGSLAPGESTSVSFTVTAAAPRPSVGTITIAFNSYNGLPATFTINNYPADYYVAVSGDNANNGLSPATAWRNIAFGVTNIPNGSADEGSITLHIGAGTYAGESTDASGTNWIIDLSNRQHINLIGAGAEQSILTRGTQNWLISFGRDTYAENPVVKLFNCEQVRVSGFTLLGNDPPAYTDGAGEGAGAPDILAAVGILGGNGVRVDHMYLNGMYTGMVYNAAVSNWVDSWESWWYFGMCVDGVIGPSNALIDHVLVRGFRSAIMNNSYPFRDDVANTHRVYVDHCTFVEGLCVSENVAAITVKCGADPSGWYSPSFFVYNSIIGDYPWSAFPGASSGVGMEASYLETAGGDYGLNSFSNQFWACGVPTPGDTWWNNQVYFDDNPPAEPFNNYTNEVPQFSTVGGLPYSTELETTYGTRDVGWNVIPEPAALLVALLALAFGRRR